jgi:predicted porin
MKKSTLSLAMLATLSAPAAFAQSHVTLYGLISEGYVYTNNVGGKSMSELKGNLQQGSRWGMRGTEDLGNGNSALFVLESGFSPDTGTSAQGNRLFGRAAVVGLSNKTWGTVTFGRQADAMSQTLQGYESAIQIAATGTHIGDNDNLFPTARISNSVQYSGQFGGLGVKTVYGSSDRAGAPSDNRSFSIGATWAQGPWALSAALHDLRRPGSSTNTAGAVSGDYGAFSPFITSPTSGAGVARQTTSGAGGSYALAAGTKVSLLFTHTDFKYIDNTGLKLSNYEASVTHFLTTALQVGGGYVFTDGKYDSNGNKPKWHQLNLAADYFFSKRTDVYLVGLYQKAAGDAQFAQLFATGPSDSKSQAQFIAGIRHKF